MVNLNNIKENVLYIHSSYPGDRYLIRGGKYYYIRNGIEREGGYKRGLIDSFRIENERWQEYVPRKKKYIHGM